MNALIKNWWKDIDRFNLLGFFILLIIGIILSFSTNDQIIYSQRHLIYSFLSIILFLSLSFLQPKIIRRLALLGLFVSAIVMIVILSISYEINGAKRWLQLWWGINLQPSEFLKPFFFVISAWLLSKGIEGQKIALYIVLIFFLFLTTLLILQPDFGMTMLFAITFFCQFLRLVFSVECYYCYTCMMSCNIGHAHDSFQPPQGQCKSDISYQQRTAAVWKRTMKLPSQHFCCTAFGYFSAYVG